VSWWHNFINFW